MSNLPTPDQPAATAAAAAANHARDAFRAELSAGTKTVADLFAAVDAETVHVLGHMHIRSALIALPHIDEVRSAAILDNLGIKHDEHVDVLGSQQRAALLAAVTG